VSTAPPIRVMIVDDHPVIHAGISAQLAPYDDITLVAAVERADEALRACAELDVDVVLMDLAMPEIDGAAATGLLLERCPDVRVIILTGGLPDDARVRSALQAGASAFLLKSVSMEELAAAIRGVTQGQSTFSSELLPYMAGRGREDASPTLTARERDILTLLAHGDTNKEIARTLGLSTGTVRVYVSSILAKLGVTNRTAATVLAMQRGLVGKRP
jgi:DNA-binding NarL/FixJ family response regulator